MRRATTRAHGWARLWWGAVTGGQYLTWWTLLATFIVAQTLLGPYASTDSPDETAATLGVSALVWAVLVLLMLPVAWGERRIPSRAGRGALVLAALVAASAVRPFLNDALLELLLHESSPGGYPQRIATNLLTWLAITGVVAIATQRYAVILEGGRRLPRAMDALAVSRAEVEAFARRADAALLSAATDLRAERDLLLAGELDFDRVREYSDVVRSHSHLLQDLAGAERHTPAVPPASDAGQLRGAPVGTPPLPLSARLRPPAFLLVGVVYIVASVPYVLSAAGPVALLAATGLALVLTATADVVARRLVRVRRSGIRATLFVLTWTVVGALLAGVGALLLPDPGAVLLVALLGLPAFAALSAVCTDALHRSTVQTRRLTDALRTLPGRLAVTEKTVRERLLHASHVLHGRVQARCVVFAAYIDDDEPTSAEISAFRDGIDAALDDALATRDDDDGSDLVGLVAAWTDVVEVSSAIDPDAEAAIADPRIARRVAAIVTEGLVNAVKHSAARTAELQIETIDDGLRVRLAAPGEIVPHIADGRGLASVGGRLSQEDRDVVLEAVVRA